jgi:HEAT repeat protein
LSAWQERNKVIEEIPREQVHLFQEFLFEVAEGKEVPALRAAALDRLCQLCDRPIENEVVLPRLASLLTTDANPAVRARLAISLGTFQSQVGIADIFLVNTYKVVLMGDNNPKVRSIAAQRLGGLLEPMASLAALRAALPLEQEENVKKSLQSAIEEAEERLKEPR